jgi:hypothetical protein
VRGRVPSALVLCWVLCVLGATGLVIWYVLWGGPPEEAPNRAQVSGTLVAAVVIVPPALAWAWRRRRGVAGTSTQAEVDAAAHLLAQRTLATWSEQLIQRGIQTPAPVRVGWKWAAEDIALPRHDLAASPSLATDPSPLPSWEVGSWETGQVLNTGLVSRLHDEVYARLQHGRLVLIGGPGAGKTGAMILLLIEAVRYRDRVPDATRAGVPVPVWLTLGSWDPTLQGLRGWVTATINRDHPYLGAMDFGPDAAAQLFDTGRIALFLDGLDEMPEKLRDAAIERLTSEAAGLRMVITSRPEEFDATIDGGTQLHYSAVVELQPVDSKAAGEYLLQGQIGATRQAWQHVAHHLLAHPDGILARTLNTPLTLSLARSAYARGDPRGLLTGELADETALRGHLLDRVLVAAYPDPRERDHVTYWLGWLAHHMNTQPSGSTRDLCWWQIPGWIGRWQFSLVRGLLVGLVVGPASGLIGGLLLGLSFVLWEGERLLVGLVMGLVFGLVVGLVFGLVGGLIGGLVGGLRTRAVTPPRSMTIRWPTRQDLRSAIRREPWSWLLPGAMLVAMLVLGLGGSVLVGVLVFGLWIITFQLVEVWRVPLAAASDATPHSVYQKDVRSQLRGAVLTGLVCGLLFGLWYALLGLSEDLTLGLVFGPISGLAIGLTILLEFVVSNNAAAASLLFTQMALRLRRRWVRFMPLLETALAGQVLRQAGAVYQFRHADLQDRLAKRYEDRISPTQAGVGSLGDSS